MSKKKHSFDPDIAEKVGVIAAVIYEYIRYWVERNRKKGVNEQDGDCWMFCSVKGFREHFSYLTKHQIEYALDKLEAEGFIKTGCYNKRSFDRTTWFTISENSEIDLPKIGKPFPNIPSAFPKIGEPIPIKEYKLKNELKNSNNPYNPFDEVYAEYPVVNDNQEVKDAIGEFIKMRDKKKKPCTPYGIGLLIKEALELAGNDPEKVKAIFDRSTANCWQGVFPLKTNSPKPKDKPKSGNQFTQLIAEEGLDDVDITDLGIDDEEEGGLFE